MSPVDDTGDVHRRLNELESDHKDLARQHAEDMRDIHRHLSDAKNRGDDKFLSKETFAYAKQAQEATVANVVETIRGIKTRLDADEAFRRQVQLGLGIAVLTSVASIAIALITALVR